MLANSTITVRARASPSRTTCLPPRTRKRPPLAATNGPTKALYFLNCSGSVTSTRATQYPFAIAFLSGSIDPQLGLHQIAQRLRIGLAARGLHGLADEPADHGRLGLDLLDLVGIGGDDLIDNGLDGAHVGHLLHAPALDDGRRLALGLLSDEDLQQVLGALGRNRPGRHEVDDPGNLAGL